MSKYLEYFEGAFDASVAEKIKPKNKPYVAYSKIDGMIYTVVPKPVVYDPWVTFTAEETNSTIGLAKLSSNQTLEYSTDTTTWTNMNTSTTITLPNIGDKVYVRGILSSDNDTSNYTQFNMTGKIAASGNCNAIWNYEDLNAPFKEQCGSYMFRGCTSLTTAPDLPATTLNRYCYRGMFHTCTSLVQAPELPATTLDTGCYNSMFYGCTSLTTVPELPATKLAESCYFLMFRDCRSLITAPELPAMTLATECYSFMFEGCTSLVQAPELPATTLTTACYGNMFRDCTSLTTAPVLPATKLTMQCYTRMFYGCTSLEQVPELPATKLTNQCYSNMFMNCTSLNYIKCLATNISASMCTYDWFKNASSTGTFIKHPDMNNWSTGISGIPEGWTIKDAVL